MYVNMVSNAMNLTRYNQVDHIHNHIRHNTMATGRRTRYNRRYLLIAGAIITAALVLLIVFSSNPDKFFGAESESGASMAQIEATTVKEKYYTSIEIHKGDTLWDLAALYGKEYADPSVFISEVKSINNLSGDRIKAGAYLFIPVYR